MTPAEFQEIFGSDPAKLYYYTGSLLSDQNPCGTITVEFVNAVNNNLINSIVTQIQGNWFVYTKDEHTILSDLFVLAVEFPLLIEESREVEDSE
jgi:hypothetical protein